MESPQYSVNWSSYLNDISHGFTLLLQQEEFVDMTLAADGHYVKVHQSLVSLVSPFIKELLMSMPASSQHPVIFLDITYDMLCYILEYVYKGEVIVPDEKLDKFLSCAKKLHIKGIENLNTINNTETENDDHTILEIIDQQCPSENEQGLLDMNQVAPDQQKHVPYNQQYVLDDKMQLNDPTLQVDKGHEPPNQRLVPVNQVQVTADQTANQVQVIADQLLPVEEQHVPVYGGIVPADKGRVPVTPIQVPAELSANKVCFITDQLLPVQQQHLQSDKANVLGHLKDVSADKHNIAVNDVDVTINHKAKSSGKSNTRRRKKRKHGLKKSGKVVINSAKKTKAIVQTIQEARDKEQNKNIPETPMSLLTPRPEALESVEKIDSVSAFQKSTENVHLNYMGIEEDLPMYPENDIEVPETVRENSKTHAQFQSDAAYCRRLNDQGLETVQGDGQNITNIDIGATPITHASANAETVQNNTNIEYSFQPTHAISKLEVIEQQTQPNLDLKSTQGTQDHNLPLNDVSVTKNPKLQAISSGKTPKNVFNLRSRKERKIYCEIDKDGSKVKRRLKEKKDKIEEIAQVVEVSIEKPKKAVQILQVQILQEARDKEQKKHIPEETLGPEASKRVGNIQNLSAKSFQKVYQDAIKNLYSNCMGIDNIGKDDDMPLEPHKQIDQHLQVGQEHVPADQGLVSANQADLSAIQIHVIADKMLPVEEQCVPVHGRLEPEYHQHVQTDQELVETNQVKIPADQTENQVHAIADKLLPLEKQYVPVYGGLVTTDLGRVSVNQVRVPAELSANKVHIIADQLLPVEEQYVPVYGRLAPACQQHVHSDQVNFSGNLKDEPADKQNLPINDVGVTKNPKAKVKKRQKKRKHELEETGQVVIVSAKKAKRTVQIVQEARDEEQKKNIPETFRHEASENVEKIDSASAFHKAYRDDAIQNIYSNYTGIDEDMPMFTEDDIAVPGKVTENSKAHDKFQSDETYCPQPNDQIITLETIQDDGQNITNKDHGATPITNASEIVQQNNTDIGYSTDYSFQPNHAISKLEVISQQTQKYVDLNSNQGTQYHNNTNITIESIPVVEESYNLDETSLDSYSMLDTPGENIRDLLLYQENSEINQADFGKEQIMDIPLIDLTSPLFSNVQNLVLKSQGLEDIGINQLTRDQDISTDAPDIVLQGPLYSNTALSTVVAGKLGELVPNELVKKQYSNIHEFLRLTEESIMADESIYQGTNTTNKPQIEKIVPSVVNTQDCITAEAIQSITIPHIDLTLAGIGIKGMTISVVETSELLRQTEESIMADESMYQETKTTNKPETKTKVFGVVNTRDPITTDVNRPKTIQHVDLTQDGIGSKGKKISVVELPDDIPDLLEPRYTMSNRGSMQLILNRYVYSKRYSSKGWSQWRCVDYRQGGCRAFVETSSDDGSPFVGAYKHNHASHDIRIHNFMKKKALYTTMELATEAFKIAAETRTDNRDQENTDEEMEKNAASRRKNKI